MVVFGERSKEFLKLKWAFSLKLGTVAKKKKHIPFILCIILRDNLGTNFDFSNHYNTQQPQNCLCIHSYKISHLVNVGFVCFFLFFLSPFLVKKDAVE